MTLTARCSSPTADPTTTDQKPAWRLNASRDGEDPSLHGHERDLSEMAVGQCKYVLVTNQDGGIIDDPVLLRHRCAVPAHSAGPPAVVTSIRCAA